MVGLLLKDLYNLSKQLRIYFMFPLLASFLGYQYGELQIVSMTLSYLSMFIVLSACAYDEHANFDSYALTLPLTRKDLILSKYILTALVIFANIIISLGTCGILSVLFENQFTNVDWQELILTVVVIGLVINLLLCILLPMIFKFGSEKARILLMVVFLGGGAMIYILATLDMSWLSTNMTSFLMQWWMYILASIVIVAEAISIIVSNRVYMKKEF